MTIQPRLLLALAAALGFFSGCEALTQTNIVGGRGDDHFGYYGEFRYGMLQIGPSNRKRTGTVIPAKSYATAPDGTRHGIATEPHEYDVTEGHPYVRERIYILDAHGQRITRRLKDGRWHFHFTLKTLRGIETRDFQGDLWTFYYNFLLHGSPN